MSHGIDANAQLSHLQATPTSIFLGCVSIGTHRVYVVSVTLMSVNEEGNQLRRIYVFAAKHVMDVVQLAMGCGQSFMSYSIYVYIYTIMIIFVMYYMYNVD